MYSDLNVSRLVCLSLFLLWSDGISRIGMIFSVGVACQTDSDIGYYLSQKNNQNPVESILTKNQREQTIGKIPNN